MNLLLKRMDFTEKSTIGELYIDDEFQCYILEDKCREEYGKPETFTKVYGKTAIPYGKYQVKITQSQRFGRLLPELLNVPQYKGIRVHVGNHDGNTEGCLLPGTKKGTDWVSNSKVAFNALYTELEKALNNGEEVWIDIIDGREAA